MKFLRINVVAGIVINQNKILIGKRKDEDIGDNQDQDDNNDSFPDEDLIVSTVLTPNENGLESTWKIINL